jgi:hypothetical protein
MDVLAPALKQAFLAPNVILDPKAILGTRLAGNHQGPGQMGEFLRNLISIRNALPLPVNTKVVRHISEYTQTEQNPIEADYAARVNGDIHQSRPGQEEKAQKAPDEAVKSGINVNRGK